MGADAPPDLVLATPRLVLRLMSPRDLDFVASMLAHPEVMRHYPRCYERHEAARWLERQVERYAEDGHGLWLALDRATGRPVGQVGLVMQDVDGVREPEVGYLLHRPFWRCGLATEAARAVRDHAFDTLDLARVISLIRPVNEPSQRVAMRMGMMPEADTVRADLDHLVFSVTRAAVAAARADALFGTRVTGVRYTPRPAVYGIIPSDDGAIAVIHDGDGYFLPGGGVEDDETDHETLTREVREECARAVVIGAALGRAVQYHHPDTRRFELQASFYAARFGAPLDGTPEHDLHWLTPEDAARRLDHECHRWAVRQAVAIGQA